MKFLCPNCQAKYRIGPEKLQGRRVARIRCRKCDYRISIERKGSGQGYDISASPHSLPAGPSHARTETSVAEEPPASTGRMPTAAVPGLPGLGSPKSARGLQQAPRQPVPEPPKPPPDPAPAPDNLAAQFRRSVEQSGAESSSELPKDGWFVGVNGVPLGPIPVGDLHELAVAGHIDRKSLVWREGFEAWRPLGKFPELVRIIDPDAASDPAEAARPAPVPPPPVPSPPGPPPPAPVHFAAGVGPQGAALGQATASLGTPPLRTGAGLAPPPTGAAPLAPPPPAARAAGGAAVAVGAPSAWADLDEEDDEDEAPTTVRGRVSAPPAGMATAGVAGAAPLPPPAAAPSVPAAVVEPQSSVSNTPEPMVEADEVAALAQGGRKKLWLAASAAVVLVAVLIFTFYTLSQQAGESGQAGPGAAPAEELEQRVPVRKAASSTPEEEAPQDETDPDDLEQGDPSDDGSDDSAGEADQAPTKAAVKASMKQESSFSERYRQKKAKSGRGKTTEAKAAKPSLLAGLNAGQAAGPTAEKEKKAANGGGAGLDGDAISRVVAKRSRSVKRSCWQRALASRAPGVPSSAKVNAEIDINPNGSVRSVRATGQRGYPGLAKCIESRIRTWRFPRASGSTTTRVPFVFVGQ